jgi:glycine cleavage system H protein
MTKKFTTDHLWIQPLEGGTAKVGITIHAQDALGDVVFIEFPVVGTAYNKGDVCGVVESVKAAADLFMPALGTVTELNEVLRDEPGLANTDPLDTGWFFKITIADAAQLDSLMDTAAYQAFCA